MKTKIVTKTPVKNRRITKKIIKNNNQLELIFKEVKNKNIKNDNKNLNFNHSVNSISRIFLSSFVIFFFFKFC